MALPDLSVRRPVTVLMATVAVTVFGFLAFRQIPVELLPDLSYPTLTVQTNYPDAAPVSVEQFVTRPIEETVGVIQGVREMRSTSRAGVSEVVLEFNWDQEMDFVALDVREKLGLVELPREADLPRVLRYDPSLDPIVRVSLTGPRGLDELRELADRWLKLRFESVNGVAAVKVRGGFDPEVQVDADEDRLAALGLTLEDLATALRAENVNQPGGILKDWGAVYLVRTMHEFEDLEQVRRTVVREGPGGRVRVEDVAEVTRGHRDRVEVTRSEGLENVELALHKEGSANTVRVARAIRERLDELRAELGPGLELRVLSDQSLYISEAVGQVKAAAIYGGILAILVLFFFLRDVASTLIVALTIPVSAIATFLPLSKVGVSLNIMSLGGLALGVGMLVDNSIVVLEAIDRRRRQGLSRREAARVGAGEVAGAVTAATLTTICVFLPIIFVQGVAGQLFYDLAVTVCLSLIASLIVSLTVIPSLAAIDVAAAGLEAREALALWGVVAEDGVEDPPWTFRLGPLRLRPIGTGRGWFLKTLTVLTFAPRLVWLLLVVAVGLVLRGILWIAAGVVGAAWWVVSWISHALFWIPSRVLDGIGHVYPGLLRGALRARWAVLPLAFGLFVIAVLGLPLLGTDLVPDLSQGEFAFKLRMPEGTPLETTSEVVERIEGLLLDDPRFASIFSTVGSLPSAGSGRQTVGENLAQINFVLPAGSDQAAETAAVGRVREALARFPGVAPELLRPAVLTVRQEVAVNVYTDDLDALQLASDRVVDELSRVSGISDLSSTAEPGSPEIRVELDRERAAALGVQAELIGRTLRHQIRGEVVGQFREEEERIDIRLRASAASRNRAAAVDQLRIRIADGSLVPVSAVASVEVGRGPAAIHRADGARVSQVTAKATGADLGATLDTVRTALAGLALPGGAVAELAGQQEELEVSFRSLQLAMLLAVFLVYVVMTMQFESLIHPFVILLAVPLGVIGVVAALLLTGTSISVLVLIGAVMLAGIVVNNAIVLVDAINRRRRAEGQELERAILGAGRERLRPILMTTTTTVLALLPMALGLGAGDELRAPLAITVIGGLTVATLLTLVVVPCIYRVFSRSARGPSAIRAGEPEDTALPAGPEAGEVAT
jgi:HAE1 family hydrophobic/amphiphilic exporter-1